MPKVHHPPVNLDRRRLAFLASVALLPITAVARAQTTGSEPPAEKAILAKSGTASAVAPTIQTETITVSATKRRQRTRSVAGAVTVFSGSRLQALGAQGYEGYLALVPGTVFSAGQPGLSTASFRGITDTNLVDQGQGTTGYFLNDIPLTEPGFAIDIPDIDTFDVNRVEVLRGPQSTLFGSATLGGAVDYVANVADPGGFDAAAETSVLGVQGHDVGHSEKVMVNVPVIAGQLAVRGVIEYRQDPGYNTNVGVGADNTNTDTIRNGRASVVWQPSMSTKLSYLFLAQNNDVSDLGYTQPYYGLYNKNTALLESSYISTQLHSLRLDQDLGFANLVALAAFVRKDEGLNGDDTPFYAGTLGDLGPYAGPQSGDSKSMYYEVRLTSPSSRRITWLVGAAEYQVWKRLEDPVQVAGAGQYLSSLYGPQLASQYAPDGETFSNEIGDYSGGEQSLFGEASYHLPAHVTFTFGGRLYWTNETNSEEQYGLFTAQQYGSPFYATTGRTSDKGFLPKFSLKYEPNRNFMAYGLVTEGYRFGQPNINPPDPQFPTPAGTQSDTLINYEVGVRAGTSDDRLIFEPTLFWINWDNIQTRLNRPDGMTYGANAGDAVSRGAEITTTWRLPVTGLQLQSNITYLDAHLTTTTYLGAEVAPLLAGTVLPTASKWNFSEVASYVFPTRYQPQISIIHHYISGATGALNSTFRQGDYNTVDLRIAAHLARYTATLFISNLTNSAGVTSGSNFGTAPQDNETFLLRPRTFGATLAWHYR